MQHDNLQPIRNLVEMADELTGILIGGALLSDPARRRWEKLTAVRSCYDAIAAAKDAMAKLEKQLDPSPRLDDLYRDALKLAEKSPFSDPHGSVIEPAADEYIKAWREAVAKTEPSAIIATPFPHLAQPPECAGSMGGQHHWQEWAADVWTAGSPLYDRLSALQRERSNPADWRYCPGDDKVVYVGPEVL